ncbi:MAG: sigma-70 family RNA polymerase sigma factor [Planctomycetales bacterium]|nr:sigma-70 family RNA polymerase sigma factor [Planctomycetales bacterium]
MYSAENQIIQAAKAGDREAFAEIVRRYQRLLCSVAYATTGSLEASEEVAQEAFIVAWKSLKDLREPDKLRSWLCGIVRNLAKNRQRRIQRDVLSQASPLDANDTYSSESGEPLETSIAREEAELLDRTLLSLPTQYREPLILFYREQQSISKVAELLELSPNTIKQRLARGRQMLRSEIAAVVERGLLQSAPGAAFTLGVLAALPVMSGSAKAATVTVASAKGITAMNAAGWSGIVGMILGPLGGILGSWYGYHMSIKAARSERERSFIRRQAIVLLVLIGTFSAAIIGLLFARNWLLQDPWRLTIAIAAMAVAYVVTLFGLIVWSNRQVAVIRREDGTDTMSLQDAHQQLPRVIQNVNAVRSYESKLRFCGLPLISVQFGGGNGLGSPSQRTAVGWIALGDKAYGVLLAYGTIAIGTVAVGAVGIGLVSLGGMALGAVALGGLAVGGYTTGGVAFGWVSFGGLAIAWKAAVGGLALSHDVALGGMASGTHVNDETAQALLSQNTFLRLAASLNTFGWWILVAVILIPMFVLMRYIPPQDESSDPKNVIGR